LIKEAIKQELRPKENVFQSTSTLFHNFSNLREMKRIMKVVSLEHQAGWTWKKWIWGEK